MSAFTPGPWRVELSSNQFETSGFVCSIVGNCDPGPDGLCDDVARVATHYDGPAMFTRTQWEANARLIAASPTMYEALKNLLDIGKRDLSNPKYDGYFESARAAIAKAESQS